MRLSFRSWSSTTIVLIFCYFLFAFYVWKRHRRTGNEKNLASKSLVWNSSKKITRFFGFLFAELCKKKLPTVERTLCFPWKRIWDTDYTRLQQNRKLSLTGNENLASNELFVWNSPSIFVCTIHQTVQKRSSKYDISLNIEKKKIRKAETVSKKKQ